MNPPPMTPPDCDLRGYGWMPLFGDRLFSSNFDAHASDLAFRVAMRLWWQCWLQVPAASLPNDDVALCKLAGLGRDMKRWRKLRADGVLHGFILCSDDRLYHGLIAEEAVKAWNARLKRDKIRDQTAERNRVWRAKTETRHETHHETHHETRHNGDGDASRRGFPSDSPSLTGQDKTRENPPNPPFHDASRDASRSRGAARSRSMRNGEEREVPWRSPALQLIYEEGVAKQEEAERMSRASDAATPDAEQAVPDSLAHKRADEAAERFRALQAARGLRYDRTS